jgi:hypothetical protein
LHCKSTSQTRIWARNQDRCFGTWGKCYIYAMREEFYAHERQRVAQVEHAEGKCYNLTLYDEDKRTWQSSGKFQAEGMGGYESSRCEPQIRLRLQAGGPRGLGMLLAGIKCSERISVQRKKPQVA